MGSKRTTQSGRPFTHPPQLSTIMFTKHTLLFAAPVLLGGFSATMNAADFTYTNASTPSATAMDATFAAATYDNVTFNFTIGYFGTAANHESDLDE